MLHRDDNLSSGAEVTGYELRKDQNATDTANLYIDRGAEPAKNPFDLRSGV